KIDSESQKLIDDVELSILKIKFSDEKSDSKNIDKNIKFLESKAKNNKYFKAKVFGLSGEVAFIKNDLNLVKTIITKIENLTISEEKLYILKANLEPNLSKKKEIIKIGIEKSNSTQKLKLYLADIFFLENNFEESVALYDEVFVNLSDEFKNYYKKRRDNAYQFIKNPPKNVNIASILNKEKITAGDMIELTLSEKDFIKKLVTEKYKDNNELFNLLKDKYYFFYKDTQNDIKINELIKRKDIAYFLIKIVSYIENKELINKYKPKETDIIPNKEMKNLSPIPDIKISDYFYSAVLILVERELMDLPDGEKFYPDEHMKGLEFYKILGKIR
ncbi:MAG TPA: hypothetical protein PK771_15285, partial [Spirochaetota bacterium]|nr:hypothetical protein [Spirochaetota bacterium]